jgi:hypothetical protein
MLAVQTQSKIDGLWQNVKRFRKKTTKTEVDRQFLWWKWKGVITTPEDTTAFRKRVAEFASSINNTGENIRIQEYLPAYDEYGMKWYPSDWSETVWLNGEWL